MRPSAATVIMASGADSSSARNFASPAMAARAVRSRSFRRDPIRRADARVLRVLRTKATRVSAGAGIALLLDLPHGRRKVGVSGATAKLPPGRARHTIFDAML